MTFQWSSKNGQPDSLDQAIGEVLGYASVCWEDGWRMGGLHSEKVLEAQEALRAYIDQHFAAREDVGGKWVEGQVEFGFELSVPDQSEPLQIEVRRARDARERALEQAMADDVVERITVPADPTRSQAVDDVLFRYSEWLDGEGVIIGGVSGVDNRSHDELVNEFLASEAEG